MEIAIQPQLRRYLARKVRSGHFKSASHLVNFALHRLQKDEQDLAWLKRELQKGIDSLDRGEVIAWDVEEAKAKLLKSVARQRRKSNGRQYLA